MSEALPEPTGPVRERLMGRADAWVPYSPALARELLARCATFGQRAVLQALLVLWQQAQRSREEPSWCVVAGARTVARELACDPKEVRRILVELVARGVLEDTGDRGSRGAPVLRIVVRGDQPPGHSDMAECVGGDQPPHPLDRPGGSAPRTLPASGGIRPPDRRRVRGAHPPPSRSSALPFGQRRAELPERAQTRGPDGPGRTRVRLQLIAQLRGGARRDAARRLLAAAESGPVDADWQRQAEVLIRKGLEGGDVPADGSPSGLLTPCRSPAGGVPA